jgi:hypothetical protein
MSWCCLHSIACCLNSRIDSFIRPPFNPICSLQHSDATVVGPWIPILPTNLVFKHSSKCWQMRHQFHNLPSTTSHSIPMFFRVNRIFSIVVPCFPHKLAIFPMCFPCFSRTRALWRWIWPWPTHPRRRRPPRAALGPTRCEALRSTAKRLRGWMWSIYLIYVVYIHTYTYRERESRYAWGVGVWKCESLMLCIYIYTYLDIDIYIHTSIYIQICICMCICIW